MGHVIARNEQDTVPEPVGDEAHIAAMRSVARGRNLQLALSCHREAIVELAIRVAEQYIHRSIALSPEIVADIYETTLKRAPGLKGGLIRVHPDAPQLEALEALISGSGFVLEKDSSITPTGCVLTAEGVEVDSRLDTALAMFRKALTYGK